eukprot:1172091-Alexandrium_andersonii.AAC.1
MPTVWATTTDASPWGTGAILSGPQGSVEYFGIPVNRPDCDRFRARTGDPAVASPVCLLALLELAWLGATQQFARA